VGVDLDTTGLGFACAWRPKTESLSEATVELLVQWLRNEPPKWKVSMALIQELDSHAHLS